MAIPRRTTDYHPKHISIHRRECITHILRYKQLMWTDEQYKAWCKIHSYAWYLHNNSDDKLIMMRIAIENEYKNQNK